MTLRAAHDADSLEDIAVEEGLSAERIGQIERSAVRRLETLLKASLTPAERRAGLTVWDVWGPEESDE